MSNRSKISKWLETERGRIKRWASHVSRKLDAADVDDLVQQVSLELLSRDDEVEKPASLAKTITIWRVLDILKQRRRDPESLDFFDSDDGSNSNFERRSILFVKPSTAREQWLDIWTAIRKLSEPGKTILCKRWMEGKTFAMIAAEVKLKESTARYHFQDAFEKLSKILKCVSLSGVITDESTNPLQAANIAARGVKTPEYRKAESDSHGQFAIIFLQTGQYSVKATKTGYSKDHRYVTLTNDTQLPVIVLSRLELAEGITEVSTRNA